MIQGDAVAAQARQWVGVRFVHQGRSRYGCDCLGFIAAMMNELGSTILLDRLPRNYGRNPQSLLIDGLTQLCRPISLEAAALVLVKFPNSEFPSHAGIYTGESMVHAFMSEGKVVEHGFTGPWRKYAVSFWALPLVVYT